MFIKKPQSEIRKHYYLNRYVVITPSRSKRPLDIHEESVLNKTESCGLCPKNIEKNLIIDYVGHRDRWQVMVLKNKFSALTPTNKNALGEQEVIIETPEHGREMADLSLEQLTRVLKTYANRVKTLCQNKKFNYILVFKNSGSKAGASLHHSHSQVFASHLLPPYVESKMEQFTAYQQEHDNCPYCDIIKRELKSKRLITHNKYLTVFTPYASEYHYEAWIVPNRHVTNITELNNKELIAIAEALKPLISKLHSQNISYNLSFDYVPGNPNQHLHLKLQPRESVWAGVEINSGLIINSVPPEEAAKFYKKTL